MAPDMSRDPGYVQKDAEYWSVYRDALRLQASCEMAQMPVQAAQAREVRKQARLRLAALASRSAPTTNRSAD